MSALLLCALACAAIDGAARAQETTEGTSQREIVQQATQQVRARVGTDPRTFDEPKWGVAPAAGAEFGMGSVIPTLHVPALLLQARLGAALHGPNLAFVLAGQTGITAALNTGSAVPYYGYLIRVPLEVVFETIYSSRLVWNGSTYLNVHGGVLGGGSAILASTCANGQCAYIEPSISGGFGLRAGLSISAGTRNSFGLFVTWHNDFAGCPVGTATDNCTKWLSTLIWSLGWTLF